eukprot:scaffold1900_cov389-Prasinococcus_capsulatus_cf.AAC.1
MDEGLYVYIPEAQVTIMPESLQLPHVQQIRTIFSESGGQLRHSGVGPVTKCKGNMKVCWPVLSVLLNNVSPLLVHHGPQGLVNEDHVGLMLEQSRTGVQQDGRTGHQVHALSVYSPRVAHQWANKAHLVFSVDGLAVAAEKVHMPLSLAAIAEYVQPPRDDDSEQREVDCHRIHGLFERRARSVEGALRTGGVMGALFFCRGLACKPDMKLRARSKPEWPAETEAQGHCREVVSGWATCPVSWTGA